MNGLVAAGEWVVWVRIAEAAVVVVEGADGLGLGGQGIGPAVARVVQVIPPAFPCLVDGA